MKIIVGIWSIFPIFSIIGIIVALNGGGEDGLLPISIGLLVLSLCLPTIIFHIFHKEIKQFFVKHKKNFVWTVSLSVVVLAIVAASVTFANHRERELLLQESIDAFKTGDFEKAQNGFEILQDKMDDPDLETIYSFVVTMQLWQSEDTDKKLEACSRANTSSSSSTKPNRLISTTFTMVNRVVIHRAWAKFEVGSVKILM